MLPWHSPPHPFSPNPVQIQKVFNAKQTVDFYNALVNAKIPVELHIYGQGGHANGIKPRDGIPFVTWHLRFAERAADLGFLKKP